MSRLYARTYEADKYVLTHCCGSIVEILPDVIEIGLDVYESVQPKTPHRKCRCGDGVLPKSRRGTPFRLLQHDMIHEFLLFYHAHAAHLHTRGTWSALKCVDMDRDRGACAPYCAPAQMTIPTITKWMLVFEDPLSPTLWLAKAPPRAWLEHDQRISVQNAPTSWGAGAI